MDLAVLEELLHECECSYLEFKATEHPFDGAPDEAKTELLKDILGLANARTPGARYMILGATEVRGGRATIDGIRPRLQDHDLQQFVNTKLNKALRFSYEIVTVDGRQIGILSIPSQHGPFFLRSAFGKLRSNIVYYRRGSSVAEMTPDELVDYGKCQGRDQSVPQLRFSLARIPLHYAPWYIGSAVTLLSGTAIPTLNLAKLSTEDLLDLERNEPKRDEEFFKQLDYFRVRASSCTPLGFCLENIGTKTAEDIRISLVARRPQGVWVLDAESLARPVTSHKGASQIGPRNFDIAIEEHLIGGCLPSDVTIHSCVQKIIPGEQHFSQGAFFIGAKVPTEIVFDVDIKGHDMPPLIDRVSITINPSVDASAPRAAFDQFYETIRRFDSIVETFGE